MSLVPQVTCIQPVATGDRIVCKYAIDTVLELFKEYTVEYVLEDASGIYVALEDTQGVWARWRFMRVDGVQ